MGRWRGECCCLFVWVCTVSAWALRIRDGWFWYGLAGTWEAWFITLMDGHPGRIDEYVIWTTMDDKAAYEAGCGTMNWSRLVRCPS
jgi:hypothetical protein